ncbi:MAG: DegT/DnrJ/EryC1/StrS family aminotransferase [Lachnospiraceae bacterium]|nr:DegT/DnrJ/EryC1/StrS family aminotransferase [Lachnospiraceae bacterium]
MIPAMNVTRQYASIQDELDKAALDVLHGGQYILGKTVEDFEKAFASYCGVQYAVGVGNGSDALVMALKACGVKPGDEVITTAMSFSATAEAITSVGATPVFADCTRNTFCINPAEIEKKITDKTKAIIPVHLYGQCADMDAINSIAKAHYLKVIEDCAQAAGATYNGKKAGSLGDVGCVSFFPTKNLGCAGDGGIIVTNNESIYRQCRAFRAHGSGLDGLYTYGIQNGVEVKEEDVDFNGNLPKYFNFVTGYNSRLDALQAAILSVKLPYLDSWNERRREIAKQYDEKITNPAISKPAVAADNTHIYYVYAITTEKRDELREYLKQNEITSGVYFPVPFHLQKVYEGLGYKLGDMPNAEFVGNHSMVLPMFPELTQEEIDKVIETVNGWQA